MGMQVSPNPKESQLHSNAIHAIANQYHVDEQDVRTLYESELRKIDHHVKVRSFLPVLCIRHVKERLLLDRHEAVLHA